MTAATAPPPTEAKKEIAKAGHAEANIQPYLTASPPDLMAFDILLDPNKFAHVQRVATLYSSSDIVPAQYRGNVANCFIALQMSMRLGVDPFMFMQNTYVVSGRPGMEAKLVIALVNSRGPFRGPIQYIFTRDASGRPTACTAFAHHKNGERCEATVTWDVVEKEGWSKRNGSKWLTMPEQMFRYRSAAFLARAYCPEVLVGMQTVDEIEDTYDGTRYIESASQPAASLPAGKMQLRQKPAAAPTLAPGIVRTELTAADTAKPGPLTVEPLREQVNQQTGEVTQPGAADPEASAAQMEADARTAEEMERPMTPAEIDHAWDKTPPGKMFPEPVKGRKL